MILKTVRCPKTSHRTKVSTEQETFLIIELLSALAEMMWPGTSSEAALILLLLVLHCKLKAKTLTMLLVCYDQTWKPGSSGFNKNSSFLFCSFWGLVAACQEWNDLVQMSRSRSLQCALAAGWSEAVAAHLGWKASCIGSSPPQPLAICCTCSLYQVAH